MTKWFVCKRLTLVAAFALTAAVASAQRGSVDVPPDVPSAAPFNPAFIAHVNALRQGREAAVVSASGHWLGLRPEPLDLSHLASQQPEIVGTLPSSFDLRTSGKVSAVRNQGSCGSCWAFGTFGSLESSLLPGEPLDFSENHLKNLHGFDGSPCSGGNASMSMAYAARWTGPVNELQDPYQGTDYNSSPGGLLPQKHVQDVVIIPGRTSSTGNDALKNALMTYGALYTSMTWDDLSYNSATKSFYYSSSNPTNHAVTLIGWDDNYSAANFNYPYPSGDGAFLIKNSWGNAWGQSGYFWISYYDAVYARGNAYAFSAEPTTNYARVYEYDPLGWVSSLGYNNTTTAWYANSFTSAAAEPLKAVSTYATSANVAYQVTIYTDVTTGPTTGTQAAATSGTFASPGYHTVVLPTPVALANGQRFSVVIHVTTTGYTYPIPVERFASGYSQDATSAAGQSYFSPNGTSWTDAYSFDSTANVCIKAFTASASTRLDLRHRPWHPQRVASAQSITLSANRPGTISVPQWVSITNTGGTPLRLSGIRTSGDFHQQNNCGASLNVGRSCTIAVWFSPRRAGTSFGELLIYDNSATVPGRIALTGSVYRPVPHRHVSARKIAPSFE